MERKLNLIELNEINFDIIKRYVDIDAKQFVSLLLSLKKFRTFSGSINLLNPGYNGLQYIPKKRTQNTKFWARRHC